MKKILFATLSAVLFAFGLAISGMTQPAKVIGFLNIGGLSQGISWTAQAGYWDPSLAFVMGGALIMTLLGFAYLPRAGKKPWADTAFKLPTRQDIDAKLVLGSALFGIGWALAGYCPGPALASLISGGLDAVLFVTAMLTGMWVAKRVL